MAKDEPPSRGTGARGRKLLRDTHESTTDPQARLYKKSTAGEAKPSYPGHVIIENRNGLVVAACATQSSTKAEREAALAMPDEMGLGSGSRPITLGPDKLYQEQKFIAALRQRNIAPHVAEYEKPSLQSAGPTKPPQRHKNQGEPRFLHRKNRRQDQPKRNRYFFSSL